MTSHQSPITPPPELVQQWADMIATHTDTEVFSAAAQWGSDQELEACRQWLINWDTCEGERLASLLHEGRRPKPPSLKEQALAELAEWENVMDIASDSPIRRALEQLPE